MKLSNVIVESVVARQVGESAKTGKKFQQFDIVLAGRLDATGEDFRVVCSKTFFEDDEHPDTNFAERVKNMGVEESATGDAYVGLSAREYQGKWYTDNKLYRFENADKKVLERPAPQEKTPEMEAAAQAKMEAAQNNPEAGTDLPF